MRPECRVRHPRCRTLNGMSAQPADSTEVREDAEIEATLTGHDEWDRAGRPGARPHAEVMAELLGH